MVYDGLAQTPTVDITTFKLLANSIISIPRENFTNTDIDNFYLMILMDDSKYMLIKFKLCLPNIIKQYNLKNKCKNGMVLAKIVKIMYRLL